jgi:phenylacetic acid degradation operon negative regulatory protein
MKQQGLVKYDGDNYEHGLVLTARGRKRAEQTDISNLRIPTPAAWDGNWRITLFDIPEQYKVKRNFLSRKLRQIGCQQLQRSVWIHPFPYREELEAITVAYDLQQYVTYMETNYIDAEAKLIERFTALRLQRPTSR